MAETGQQRIEMRYSSGITLPAPDAHLLELMRISASDDSGLTRSPRSWRSIRQSPAPCSASPHRRYSARSGRAVRFWKRWCCWENQGSRGRDEHRAAAQVLRYRCTSHRDDLERKATPWPRRPGRRRGAPASAAGRSRISRRLSTKQALPCSCGSTGTRQLCHGASTAIDALGLQLTPCSTPATPGLAQ